MRVVAVIPARYASTRFPGKPLAKIHGKPMVQWVYERVGFNMGNRVIDLFASPYPSDRAGRFYVASVDTPSTTLQDNGSTCTITAYDNSSTPTIVSIVYPN